MDRRDGRRALPGRRFLATTKGTILVLLCRGRHTVSELADHLNLTDNAVRAQLHRLQRDGLARRAGWRRGVRRPHAEYELTRKARDLFPRAYEPVLQKVVEVLAERLPQRVARDLLLQAARRLVRDYVGQPSGRSPAGRLTELMAKLNGSSLGIEVEAGPGSTVVRSCSCPIASVTAAHPEVCDVFASLLGEVLGVSVHDKCERGESPRCCFEIAHNAKDPRGRARRT